MSSAVIEPGRSPSATKITTFRRGSVTATCAGAAVLKRRHSTTASEAPVSAVTRFVTDRPLTEVYTDGRSLWPSHGRSKDLRYTRHMAQNFSPARFGRSAGL